MSPTGRRAGTSASQTPAAAIEHRGWKWHPGGGSIGDGTSPWRISRFRGRSGSGIGIADSSACVYGWVGLRVERVAIGDLDDPAEVHDRDPVADVLHHGEVVGDEQQREVELLLQLLEEVEHLGLHGDVESRHRLVGNDEVRLQDQGPGDADPLALAAGELVRVSVGVRRVEPDELEHVGAPGPAAPFGCRHRGA